MAAGLLAGPRLGVPLPGSAGAATGAHKAMVRALLEQVTDAGRLIWKTLLKPDQRAATRSRQRYHRMSSSLLLTPTGALHHK
jgi:hypothetical protein